MRLRLGSLGWTRETNGVLDPRDRMRLLGQGVVLLAHTLPATLLHALGLRRAGPICANVDTLRLPDSPACRDAEAICEAKATPQVVNHSYRSYVWAAILAGHDRLRFDEEILYIACLLHDIGFTNDPDPERPHPHCFTLVGADAALELAGRLGDRSRAEAVAHAITMHVNLWVRPSEGVEPHLLTIATKLDVMGTRFLEIDPVTARAVLERYPRRGLKQAFCDTMSAQTRMNPGSRVHFYTRLGANVFIWRAPFDD